MIAKMIALAARNGIEDLHALVKEARGRYDARAFDDAWIARVESAVSARWPRSSADERQQMVELMELTPSLRWMHDYLVPAERGQIVGADLLIEHFEQIASMFGEAVSIQDGFTAPSWGPDSR